MQADGEGLGFYIIENPLGKRGPPCFAREAYKSHGGFSARSEHRQVWGKSLVLISLVEEKIRKGEGGRGEIYNIQASLTK